GGRTGGVSMAQVVTAEQYVIAHHLGDVISQSFVATEQGIGSAGIAPLRAAAHRDAADVTWNDTYSSTASRLVDGNSGPDPLAGGGGRSVIFGRPAYQNLVQAAVR